MVLCPCDDGAGVEPMTGHRHVLVAQWWIAPAHTDTRTGPAPAMYFTEGQ